METYDYSFKIIVLGDKLVGKSSLISRLTLDTFTENTSATIGFGFYLRDLEIQGKRIKVRHICHLLFSFSSGSIYSSSYGTRREKRGLWH